MTETRKLVKKMTNQCKKDKVVRKCHKNVNLSDKK